MMALFFSLEYTGILANPPSGWKKVKAKAYKDGARAWHTKFAAGHFELGAYRKYGYRKRTKSYNQKKLREKKHLKPLVWDGKVRHDVLHQWRIQGRRGGGASVIMNAPGLNWKRHSGKSMRVEMETVTRSERDAMAKVVERSANRGLRSLKPKKRRRKRIGG